MIKKGGDKGVEAVVEEEGKKVTPSADQIVDDATKSTVFPEAQSPKGMAIPENIVYMAVGGFIVAMAAMVLHFVKAKKSKPRGTSGQEQVVELPASAVDA